MAACKWCGKDAGSDDAPRCPHCGGKLGQHVAAVARENFAREDAARAADPLRGNPGAAEAFRELWVGPVMLGLGVLSLGVSALVAGPPRLRPDDPVGLFDAMRLVALPMVLLGGWFFALGLTYRATRRSAVAFVLALSWLVGALGLPGWAIADDVGGFLRALGRQPRAITGILFWVVCAFAPLVRVWRLHQVLERVLRAPPT